MDISFDVGLHVISSWYFHLFCQHDSPQPGAVTGIKGRGDGAVWLPVCQPACSYWTHTEAVSTSKVSRTLFIIGICVVFEKKLWLQCKKAILIHVWGTLRRSHPSNSWNTLQKCKTVYNVKSTLLGHERPYFWSMKTYYESLCYGFCVSSCVTGSVWVPVL